jgi:hypothetical protein
VGLKYRVEGGDSLDLYQNDPVLEKPAAGTVVYTNDVNGTVLMSAQTFQTDGRVLDWTIDVANRTQEPIQIGDFALSLPWRAPGGEDPEGIFEKSWTKHQFISGHASFLYFVRPNGEPPYLVVTTQPGTKLEYSTSPGGRGNGFLAFMHSAVTGGSETRAILFDEGLFDVRVVPGMTVPDDLDAEFSLHTKARIEGVRAEFPAETVITSLGEPRPDHRLYRVRFSRLGENRLTIVHDGGRETHLEFFVTEPLETLIKKRANFIATRQQHRDPEKWYDELFSVYDTRAKVLRSPDDTDGFDYRTRSPRSTRRW